MSYQMEPGYAYKRVRGEWDTVMVSENVTDKATFLGFHTIDGHRMGVFKHGRSHYAQLPQNLRQIGQSRYASRTSRAFGNSIKKYRITQIGTGKHTLWQARMHGHHAVGAGSRPDLAIRDLHEQRRRWDEHAKKNKRRR